MARLKKTKQAAPAAAPIPEAREPIPPHVRTPEWNGLKQGDPVIIKVPGKKAKRGYHYKFSNHVVSPQGHVYLDVIEYRVGYSSGLWRSFPPEQVFPKKK